MKNTIIKLYLSDFIKRGITALGVVLIAHHVSQSDSNSFLALFDPGAIAGWLIALIGELSALWAHRKEAANQTGAPTPTANMRPTVPTVLIIFALFLLLTVAVRAQTVSPGPTNEPGSLSTNVTINLPLVQIGASSNTVTVLNDVASWFAPMIPYLTNHNISLGIAPLYGQGKFGEMAHLLVPIGSSDSPLSIGVGEAYADDTFFVAPLAAKLGTTIIVPIINRPFYVFAEEGLALECGHSLALGSQTAAGAITGWDINSQLNLYTEGGVAKFTQLNGNDYFFGIMINWHPAKW